MKALIVSDSVQECLAISNCLDGNEWTSSSSAYEDALHKCRVSDLGLIIISLAEEKDGLRLLTTIRALGIMTPVICLGSIDTKIKEAAFDAGADEYLGFPLHLAELEARVRNLQSRISNLYFAGLSVGETRVDARLRLVMRGDRKRHLSEFECMILAFLMANSRHAFSAGQLFDCLWTKKENSSEATIRVHINSLRKKLEEIGSSFFIRTVRGKGYMVYQ